MRRWILAIWLMVIVRTAWAGGWTVTYPLAGGVVALTNAQANSSWVPVSVMLNFAGPSSGTAEVWRVCQAQSFILANCTFSNVANVVWVPDAQYPFGCGDALVVRSSVTNGVAQIIRRGD